MDVRPLIVGNWKMNLDRAAAVKLAQEIRAGALELTDVDVAVCPPAVYLDGVAEALAGSNVAWGAQNVYPEPPGAFTGEIATSMLADLGCRYVIVGHSERRQFLAETDEFVNRKSQAALAAGLIPILCVGESLAQREEGRTFDVITKQFEGSLAGFGPGELARMIVAYEPVWAIGTGKVATPQQAEEVHAHLRNLIGSRYNSVPGATGAQVRILYGGSVKASNARELLAQPNINGALVGGASLKADEFLAIARGGIAVA